MNMVRVKEGKARFIAGGNEIPVAHLGYQVMPSDGFYKSSAATCGNNSGCYVGNHKKDCVSYCRGKCAVYFLTNAAT